MPAPPSRANLFNPISKALANTRFGELYDYIVALLGSTGTPADARTALGATTTGAALFTSVDAAAARKAAGVPNSGPLSGLRNLIINGNFAINQRGYVSGTATTTANQYTLDRWRVVTSGQAITFGASGAGNLVTAPAGGLEQVIEGASIGGGTYTVNWTGTATCTVNGTARAKGATFALTAGANATVRFVGGTVSEVQVEPGEVVTGFETRPVGVELFLCHRYYRSAIVGFDGYHVANGWSRVMVPLVPPMRTSPTVTQSAVESYNFSASILLTDVGYQEFFSGRIKDGVSGAGTWRNLWFASAEL